MAEWTGHTIWQGDARELAIKLPQPIDCVVVDPPYGLNFHSKQAELPSGKKWVREIEGDEDLEGALELFTQVMSPVVEKLTDPSDVYVFTRWSILGPWCDTIAALGLTVMNCIIWDKGTPGMGDVRCNWPNTFEMIVYAKKGRRVVPERRSSIISVNRPYNHTHFHPTQKPTALLEVLLKISTEPGDLVVDPFCGSGSTIIAAQRLGRAGIGIEIDPEYVRLARERLSQPAFDI
jgi:adenine-specific DNA-methyltransferase